MYERLRTNKIAELLIIAVRFLVGLGFIPSGMVKLMGYRFTSLSPETPIGYFFEAMYQSGIYWNFLGFCQVLTAFLLFTQRFATLGALFLFGLMLNIFVITVSINFKLTWVITMLMLFASILLLLWDWYRLKPVLGFYPDENEIRKYNSPSLTWQIIGFVAFCGIIAVLVIRKTMLNL